jgi:hypothetical protein
MKKPRTLDESRENIRRKIQMVPPEFLAATFRNMQRRVQLCIDAQGGHFQHLLSQMQIIQLWHANVNQHVKVLYFCSFVN